MEKEKKFISLMSDSVFKYMFKNERFHSFFRRVIKYAVDVDIEGYTLYDNELNSGNKIKDYRLDILLKKGNDLISIEMNKDPSTSTLIKNHSYLFRLAGSNFKEGEIYKQKQVIQINFNNSLCPINPRTFCLTYDFRDIEYQTVIEGIKDYEVYLHKFKGISYNEVSKDARLISLFTGESYEELRKIAGEDKEALYIVNELEKLGINDEFNALYEEEIIQKKLINTARVEGIEEGIKEGREKEKILIAKNFLKDGIPIDVIAKNTNLSITELEKLKSEL